MKIKDLDNSLSLMEDLIEKVKHNQELSDLIGYYAFMKNNSAYYFSDNEPGDIIKNLEEMAGDISTIKDDMQNVVNDHGQELEV
jgi:hypothetical protein